MRGKGNHCRSKSTKLLSDMEVVDAYTTATDDDEYPHKRIRLGMLMVMHTKRAECSWGTSNEAM